MKRKISPSYPREGKGRGKHPEHFIGGLNLLSKGGAVQNERQNLGSSF
jgi:hypothetical protein